MILRLSLTERQKEIATGLFVLVVAAALFAGGEGAVRVLNYVRFGDLANVDKSDNFYLDAETGLRLAKPNTVQGGIRINALGFRSPEITVPKPPDTIRLAFVGSSSTFDPYASSNEKTWPFLTWHRLQQRFPNCRFDYVNAGLPGFPLAAMVTYFESRVAKLDPDVVFVLSRDFNHDADGLAEQQGLIDETSDRPSWLARRSLLWEKLEKNLRSIMRQRRLHDESGKLVFEPSSLAAAFEQRLREFTTATSDHVDLMVLLAQPSRLRVDQTPTEQRQAAASAVLYMPYMSVDGLFKGMTAYNEAVARVADTTGSLFIDANARIPV